MSLLNVNRYFKDAFKLCVTFQRRFQQTKVKPKLKSSSTGVVPVFRKAAEFSETVAFCDTIGSYTYGNIFIAAKELSDIISQQVGNKTRERVLFLCPNDASYLITQWAIWMSGQIGLFLIFSSSAKLCYFVIEIMSYQVIKYYPEY